MRRLLLGIVCGLILTMFGMSTALAESMMLEYDGAVHEYNGAVYALVVNNSEITPPLAPIIFNDRALVPVREIFEEVGATVEYDGSDQSITIYNSDATIVLFINNNIAYINGKKVAIPDNVVPKLISKLGGETKTMVPVRFISENIGMPVEFDAKEGAILIASDNYDFNREKEQAPVTIAQTPVPVTKAKINDVSYVAYSNSINITVTSDKAVESISDFTLNDPGRLVVDFYGSSLNINKEVEYVNEAGISAIRYGDNGERARMVIDSECIKSYDVSRISNTKIAVTIKTKPQKQQATVTPAVTKAPVVTEAPKTTPTPTKRPSNGKANRVVMLDAGHGGVDSGAVGELDDEPVYEKNLTLSITYKVKSILEDNGIKTSMTRTGDTLPSLVERPTQANEEEVALFVSIHINSVDDNPEANGIEVFYSVENNEDVYGTTSSVFATNLLKGMLANTGAVSRGVKTANHAVTRRCNMPASLVECGFITNETEVSLMSSDDYQWKLAQGIADGIIDTLPSIRLK